VRGGKVKFFVPESFLGSPPADWSYAVAVSVANIDARMTCGEHGDVGMRGDTLFVLPSLSASDDCSAAATKEMDLQTPFVDILVPEGASQEKLLRSYDIKTDALVKLPGVKPGPPK
jgi:hypothetical protein